MTLVSIIVPYFEKELFIEDSIRSILNQSYKNFEILIINDEVSIVASNVLEKIANLDSRIKIIDNKKNIGAGQSRNKGINHSKGDYIAFCDSDDLWKKNKLEVQLAFMKNFNLDFSFTSYEIIDENKKFISHRKAKDSIGFSELRNSCDIGLSTVIIKKKFLIILNTVLLKLKPKKIMFFG